MALDPDQVLKLNDLVVTTTDPKLTHAGSNPTEGILVTCLNVDSLLKKLFSCTNKACHNNKPSQCPKT